jgi:hypothetical protein
MALISFLFSEIIGPGCAHEELTDGQQQQLSRLIVRILQNSSHYSFNDQKEILQYIYQKYFSSSLISHRILFWKIYHLFLQSYLSSDETNSENLLIESCQQLLEKLPFYLRTILNSEERTHCLNCLQVLFDREHEILLLSSKYENILTKLLTTAIRLMKSESDSHHSTSSSASPSNHGTECLFGLQLLSVFYQQSHGRLINNSHGNMITNLCLDLVLLRGHVKLSELGSIGQEIQHTAAQLFAVNISYSTVEVYEKMWLTITEGLLPCSLMISLSLFLSFRLCFHHDAPWASRLGTLFTKSISCLETRSDPCLLDHLSGPCWHWPWDPSRDYVSGSSLLAIRGDHSFLLASEVSLWQMLRFGSSSGAICLNYSQHLFPSLLSAICHQLDVKSQDPKVRHPPLSLVSSLSFPSVLHSKPVLDRSRSRRCHFSQSQGESFDSTRTPSFSFYLFIFVSLLI